jgi:L-ornithine Nalpha-acyltransferase
MKHDRRQFTLKLAETEAEIFAAQRLRFRVFVTEMGARANASDAHLGLERDAFDPFFDHLILIDGEIPDDRENVIGVYRLMRSEVAASGRGYYGASEYDLSKISACGRKAVELGRSCVDARYRGGIAMHLLWNGLADYVLSREIEIMFGVASFPGTEVAPIAQALSFLHHFHLAPEPLRVSVHPAHARAMDILSRDDVDPHQAKRQIPPLIQAYLRLGGFVGDGAYIDRMFNTVDVCLLMDTRQMSQRHRAYYQKTAAQ